ncbi:MAG: hypothetical protein N3B18_06765 [Desulfobacterota bacterium]|nr:hypothetical protein [Thermodesulfobacteriota bacterium]
MDFLKRLLVDEAKKEHVVIEPLQGCDSFENCFTHEGNTIIFWFLTRDGSTHILIAEYKNGIFEKVFKEPNHSIIAPSCRV